MNTIKRYYPGFVESKEEVENFQTIEDLTKISWVKTFMKPWLSDKDIFDGLVIRRHKSWQKGKPYHCLLMAKYINKDSEEVSYWNIGYLKNDIPELPSATYIVASNWI